MTADRVLILGASGYIGRALLDSFGAGKAVGTGFSGACAERPRFDARSDDIRPLLDRHGPFGCAYILMAESRIERCAEDPEGTEALNVAATIRVIDRLRERRIRPVFASTDCVFDGRRGDYGEDDPAEPILTYGRQKRAVERYLARSGGPHVIVRLSKVLDADPEGPGMLGEWVRAIRAGRESLCATDQQFSAIDRRDVVRALVALGREVPSGIYHVGGPRPWNRAALFDTLADALRRYADIAPRIRRCSIHDLPGLLERRPLDISMRSDRLAAVTGVRPRDLSESCREIARSACG